MNNSGFSMATLLLTVGAFLSVGTGTFLILGSEKKKLLTESTRLDANALQMGIYYAVTIRANCTANLKSKVFRPAQGPLNLTQVKLGNLVLAQNNTSISGLTATKMELVQATNTVVEVIPIASSGGGPPETRNRYVANFNFEFTRSGPSGYLTGVPITRTFSATIYTNPSNDEITSCEAAEIGPQVVACNASSPGNAAAAAPAAFECVANCPNNTQILSGGCRALDDSWVVNRSYPQGNAWFCRVTTISGTPNQTGEGYALCI